MFCLLLNLLIQLLEAEKLAISRQPLLLEVGAMEKLLLHASLNYAASADSSSSSITRVMKITL
jgi:hypothetical protein